MKKKLALLLALIMVCATMLTACGGSKVVGSWELDSASAAGIEITAEQVKATGNDMSFEFKDNGKVKVFAAGEEQGDADWKEDGDKVIITEDSNKLELTLKDGKLSMEVSGATLVFKKK